MPPDTHRAESRHGLFRRRAWFCRLFGHRYLARNGWPVHFFLPSAEGSMGLPDSSPIGVCDCGARWERSRG
jgi:hypothetical protein